MEFVFAVDDIIAYSYIAINLMEILNVKINCPMCVHVCGVVHVQPVENGSHATVLLNK